MAPVVWWLEHCNVEGKDPGDPPTPPHWFPMALIKSSDLVVEEEIDFKGVATMATGEQAMDGTRWIKFHWTTRRRRRRRRRRRGRGQIWARVPTMSTMMI